MNPRRRFPDFMASCFKMSQHRRELRIANCELRIANCELRIANCELRIANCKLRISGLRPGVIYFASKNWAEGPAQAGPGQASSPREGCKALLRGNACATPGSVPGGHAPPRSVPGGRAPPGTYFQGLNPSFTINGADY